jgi:transcription-repair coupling factor (superfamily II helicase)
LVPFREQVIRDAIRHEMQRHGQVYFVHNRVESIYSMAGYLQKLVPECRIAVAHGQMPEHQLERAMLDFIAGEHDVLVSTTIIENGLDLPRVNTLLVNRADRFGLSQLYQLRGRIGRSDLQAYAYLMVPPGGVHRPLARRRLAALQEFSDLGSGFRIAAMDLELRGAGNLLGSQQHGHVAAVGFEMYCRMIESAVRELQGEEVEEAVRTTIHLGVDIRLPESFIEESNQRLMVYKRIASAQDEERLGRIRDEMVDRFGALPPQGEHLFRLASLRLLAERLRVRKVDIQNGALQVKLAADAPVEPDRLVALIGREPGITLTSSGLLRLACTGGPEDRLSRTEALLQTLA